MAYDTRYPFIKPTLVDEYDGAVDDLWGNCAEPWVYLLSHRSKIFLCAISQLQMYSYNNFSNNEDIVSCEWTKELFVNSSYLSLVKSMEDKYEALDGLEKGGIE